MTDYRREVDEQVTFDHLIGRIDVPTFLEELGINVAYPLGEWWMCHCPDLEGSHRNGDANPSFGFDREELVYNCFVCGGGSILDLVRDIEGLDDDQAALRYCEERSDLEPSTSEEFVQEIDKILHPEKTHQNLATYPEDLLFQYRYIHPYLLDRGISKEILIEMQVGYDESHHGIMFPTFYGHKLVGWQVRHLVVTPDGRYLCPKCYNPDKPVSKYKSSPSFPKNTILYGYDRALDRGAQWVIVVESPVSALYLMTLGYDAVATFGVFSDAQMMLLARFSRVSFWTDNDGAGQNHALKGKKGKHGKREPSALQALSPFTYVDIIPLVGIDKGDPNDVAEDEVAIYLNAAFPASLLPLYGGIPTLETVLTATKV